MFRNQSERARALSPIAGGSGDDIPQTKRPPEGRSGHRGEESPCLGRVIALAVLVRASGSALTISVVESGDLVSGLIISPSGSGSV